VEPAYVLEMDGAAKTGLVTMRSKIDQRVKVRVQNTEDPDDVRVVDAWWSGDASTKLFNYEDGPSGEIVSFGPEMADIYAKDCR